MNVRQISNTVLMMALALFITNCGQSLQSGSDTELVALKLSNEQESTLLNGEQVPYDEQEPPSDEGEEDGGITPENGSDSDGDQASNEDDSNIGDEQDDDSAMNENEGEDEESDNEATEEGEQKYICILDGPGKSVRLGFINEELTEHGKTPGVVCMSKKACNEQVSRAFNVKGPHKRGFCPNRNPHVLTMSYDQIKSIIDNEVNQEEE